MQLRANGDLVSENPDAQAIERRLKDLKGENDSFAILEKAQMTYIRTSGSPADGFVLEYQDGSLDQHFACSDPDLDSQRVTRAFTLFLDDDQSYKTEFNWEKQDVGDGEWSRSTEIIVGAITILGVLILVASVIWKVAA